VNPRPLPDLMLPMTAEPWRFDYFHALRWIDAQLGDKPRLGTARRPVDEPVRLGQAPEMSFAPASLHAVSPADDRQPRPRVEVRFFGLFGPQGPLPLHLTDYARERLLHHDDPTFARFADIFHHRLLLLFYRAWAQAQPVVGLDRATGDRFADIVGALIGVGLPSLQGRDAAPGHIKLHFSGLLTRQVRNADGLANMLSGYLRRPVTVAQFAGRWMALQTAERTRIGRQLGGRANDGARLGAGAVLGGMVWDRQHGFRVHIGPLERSVFESLLPDGSALASLMALVQQYVGDEFEWDLALGHIVPEIQPIRLGRHGRLGWTSWIAPPRGREVAELRLSPASAMRAWQRRTRVPSKNNTLQ
jgi:type VI secretion system protein ImpH